MKKDRKYKKDYPHRLYIFFATYSESVGAPSFDKFARSIGLTLEDVETFREHKEFNRAYLECIEIRRDYLIDNALSKRFDSSFVKFLLSDEMNERDNGENELELTLRVLSENDEN